MLKKGLLILISTFFIISVVQASDFNGMWKGEANGVYIVLSITQNGNKISGTYDIPTNKKFRASKITGTISGRKISFQRRDELGYQNYTGYLSTDPANTISGTFYDLGWKKNYPWSLQKK
ncbi:MAG: hypothetical protein KAH03_01395 [Cocleimonas sp.]|nr:hypothetical protein [Cocleimonas sp.]